MMKDPYSVPKAMRETYEAISVLTDDFCRAKLNDEYADICRQMTAKLARKRPSPLKSGRPQNWAAGVVHAVASVNFAFDKSQDPHITAPEISQFFGVGKSSPSAKSKVIRDLFDIYPLEPEWTLPSRMDDNPMAWFIMVDGLVVDARSMPLEIQIIAYEQGVIPYIPDLQE
jgi:hypothetical protein